MGESMRLAVLALVLSIVACGFAGASWWNTRRLSARYGKEPPVAGELPATKGSQAAFPAWLAGTTEERFRAIERHLRGLDQAMAEIGYRYRELHFTSQERNWDYARYDTEKIDLALRLALERRPKRARSAQPFLEEDLPAVFEAIQSRDATRMGRAMERLERACVECHRRENVLYFRDAVERLRDATSR